MPAMYRVALIIGFSHSERYKKMTVYIAVCQYIWCDKKHNPKDFGLSTNKPFTNEKNALKELRRAAEEAISEMQEWSTACEKDQYPEIPIDMFFWCSADNQLQEFSGPLNKATLPKDKITDFDIRTKDPMYIWSGHIEKQEINDFRY